MEKLMKLLNQFEKEKKSGYTWNNIDSYDNCVYGVDSDGETEITMYSDLYSKYYGFIKWLVDNDKIDLEKLDEKAERKPQYTFTDDEGRLGFKLFEVYESLLMLLSIQDSPIEFLCSVLK